MPALLVALWWLAHPIHSSTAALTLAGDRRTLTVVLRAFADDFPPGPDSAGAARYLDSRFILSDRSGRRLPLELRSLHPDGAALVLTLSAASPHELRGLQVWHGVLTERFADQVNLVRAQLGGWSGSLLFSPGDGPKPLP